jgi:hypothetical protein
MPHTHSIDDELDESPRDPYCQRHAEGWIEQLAAIDRLTDTEDDVHRRVLLSIRPADAGCTWGFSGECQEEAHFWQLIWAPRGEVQHAV